MKFLVTDIKFDFNSDLDPIYSVSEEDQELITREHLGAWDADDEDDLSSKRSLPTRVGVYCPLITKFN